MDLVRTVQPLAWGLAPILIVQGMRLRRRIPRLPEAADPHGTAHPAGPPTPPGRADPADQAEAAPEGPTVPAPPNGPGGPAEPGSVVRLAVFGDSTAAGVGAKTHDDALAGRLGAALAAATGREVSWRAVARSGATSLTARELVPELVEGGWRPDAVVVLIGVNDLKNLRRLRDWDRDVPALLDAIRRTTGDAPMIVSGMAPLRRFPALPQPMRAVMALRARAMDGLLHRVAQDRHIAVDDSMIDADFFAEDGFHPSAHGYRVWAEHLAGPVTRLVGEA